ncbi:hypothetical protein ABEB36_010162 [Hypothenemus hampei]|uniref:SH3 domain-containing protein n=1 Tax=Hypothenemus hampei TaxID=57062 RepID=A0ABD1EKT8_HYPHA
MGQKSSKRSDNALFYQKKFKSFLSKKYHATGNFQEPIKFKWEPNSDRDSFSISNFKNVLDGVKSECKVLKRCSSNGKTKTRCRNEIFVEDHFTSGQNRLLHSSRNRKTYKNDCNRNESKSYKIPMRTNSEPNLKHQRGRERSRRKREKKVQQFGYQIQDVDEFLSKATIEKPANIPVVLALPSILYQTTLHGRQSEISLPLGMVVNAIFRNHNWLYVQTPHAEEGYITYSACLPLGIIPATDDDNLSPCWEKSSDIFPKPSRTMVETEKLSSKSENNDEIYSFRTKYRDALSSCGEKSVDTLYLRAIAITKGKGTRHTLLVMNEDYTSQGKDSLSVSTNEVVFLLDARIKGWFYVRNKEGKEGFIPSAIAGHGFL